MDYHFALLNLPGRSAAGIFNQWKAILPTLSDTPGNSASRNQQQQQKKKKPKHDSNDSDSDDFALRSRTSKKGFDGKKAQSALFDGGNEESNTAPLVDPSDEQLEFVKLWGSRISTSAMAHHFGISKSALYKRVSRIRRVGTPELKKMLDKASASRAERNSNVFGNQQTRRRKRDSDSEDEYSGDQHFHVPKRTKFEFDNSTGRNSSRL